MSRAQHNERIGTNAGSDLRRLTILHNLLVPDVQFTVVGNVTTGEDDLMSYTIPADALAQAGHLIRVIAWGSLANNANAKTLKGYFGSGTFLSLSMTASAALNWYVDAYIIRTGSDTQDTLAQVQEGVATLAASKQATILGTLTADEDVANTLKFTGEATSTNDILQEGMIVLLPTAAVANRQGTILVGANY